MAVLTVNAGSTSLKLHLVDGERIEPVESFDVVDPARVEAVGHRIVHGGPRLRRTVLLDARVEAELRAAIPLAPLHNQPAVRAIDAAREAFPAVPHVAVFDTAFHETIPGEAATYAVPARWREEWGIRRFGFHGLSVEGAAERVRVPRLVVCHLGGGCSVTAVLDGRSVDTTMGFSPLEGVVMATRAGSLDPGALLYLLREGKLSLADLDGALEHDCGLQGLSETSGSVRDLEAAEAAGDERAALALSVYVYRLAAAVAALAAALGGLDAIVFTGGVGENSALVRGRVCRRLAFLGVRLAAELNAAARPDCDVAARDSAVRVHVLHAREELMIARAVGRLLTA